MAPLHSWTIGYDIFEEIIVAQAIEKHNNNLKLIGGIKYESARADGRQKHIDKHCNDVSPLSEEQIQAGFQAYRAEAEATNTLLHSDALKAAWTRALQKLPRARSFRFSSSEWDENRRDYLPVQPDCVVRPHGHDGLHAIETCERALAVVGDAVFAAGIACLSEAGVEVEALKVACVMTTSFRWEDLPGWKSLNLAFMRRFKFQPRNGTDLNQSYPDAQPISQDPERDYAVARGANEAVASVMKKSASHLEYFRYDGMHSPMRWPGDETVSLPRLLHLDLSSGTMEATGFKKWMAGMPSLQELVLECLRISNYYPEWLNVFDAIRHHPIGMRVIFNQIINCHYTELSIDYHTNEYEKFLKMGEGRDWIDDNKRSLALYLSGKGGYNRILREMVEDDDEPS